MDTRPITAFRLTPPTMTDGRYHVLLLCLRADEARRAALRLGWTGSIEAWAAAVEQEHAERLHMRGFLAQYPGIASDLGATGWLGPDGITPAGRAAMASHIAARN